MYKTNKEKVAAAATLMDKLVPGWWKAISIKQLDMASGTNCLLGQTFGTHIEETIVKKVYAEEYEAATLRFQDDRTKKLYGYSIGRGRNGMVQRIMKRLGLANTMGAEYWALEHVCNGQNTRCEWIAEVTDRKLADEEAHAQTA